MHRIINYVLLMRPIQWVKNILCFAGVIFSGRFIDISYSMNSLLCFTVFCMTASVVYIFNDMMDVNLDRRHKNKSNRPLASGKVSIYEAGFLLIILLTLSIYYSLCLSHKFFWIVVIYLLMNIVYSIKLKHLPIIDIFVISIGFILRLLAGTLGLDILPTEWIIICTFMLSLFFAAIKRYSELIASDDINVFKRPVLNLYSEKALETMIAISAAGSILSYSIFIISKDNLLMLITIIPVVYAVFHIILDLHVKNKGEDFSKELFGNYHILLSIVIWLLLYCIFAIF